MSLTVISKAMNYDFLKAFRHSVLILFGMLGVAHPALAIDPHSKLPINIESDTALLDDKKGISVYEGNVIISQGETKLSADNITVIAVNRRITKIEAKGQPAHFQQRSDNNTQTQGSAKIITYIAKDNMLRFEQEAALSQANNSFSGETIEYDLAQKAIKATGNEEQGGRVKIQYHPEHEDTDNSQPSSPQP